MSARFGQVVTAFGCLSSDSSPTVNSTQDCRSSPEPFEKSDCMDNLMYACAVRVNIRHDPTVIKYINVQGPRFEL